MAWTEQCKIAFKTSATGKLGKYKNKNRKVSSVLRELSRESEIPFATLKKWFYEKNQEPIRGKNGPDKKETQICSRCKKNPVFLTIRGKPLTEASKHYGLCGPCRDNQKAMEIIDRYATEEKKGIMTVCPYCERMHYADIEKLIKRKKEI